MTTHSLRSSVRSSHHKPRHRTLLLTFDAFGTLFHPRQPVPEQYAATAHEFGLSRTAITPQTLKTAFKDVFRRQAKHRPNYGRADVLRGQYGGPRQWWEEVIRGSFAHALSTHDNSGNSRGASHHHITVKEDLPPGMVEALLDRFAGAEGYSLYEDVTPFFARMRELRYSTTAPYSQILLGVISNSDDRVPAVLKSLGLRVGDMRADQDRSSMELPGFEERGRLGRSINVNASNSDYYEKVSQVNTDLDLVITSYEAGEEKPSRLIFDVARRQARLLAHQNAHTHGSAPAGVDELKDWVCVHVGDDYEKDYRGAIDAGWHSYLLPRGEVQDHPAPTISSLMDVIHEMELDS